MKNEAIKSLINTMVGNEYSHIQEGKEFEFENSNLKHIELTKEIENSFDELLNVLNEEQKLMLDKLYTDMTNRNENMCNFYFNEGVRAGVSSLKSLNNIENIEIIL